MLPVRSWSFYPFLVSASSFGIMTLAWQQIPISITKDRMLCVRNVKEKEEVTLGIYEKGKVEKEASDISYLWKVT